MSIWNLHSGTLALMSGVLTASSAAMAFIMARAYPEGAPVARSWGWAMTAATTAFIFWFLGQEWGWWAEFLVGNLGVIVCSVFFLKATCLLTGMPIHVLWLVVQAAIGISGIALVQLGVAPRPLAVVTIGLSLLIAGLGSIVAIARNRDIRATHWGQVLMAVLAAWTVLVVGVRLYVLFYGGGMEAVRPVAASQVAAMALFAGTLMLMVVSKGLLAIMAEQLRQAVLESASRDGLTGTLTRTAFFEQAHRQIGGTHPYAVLMIDVDHFKSINDSYGHPAGDAVLRHAAMQVLRQVRSTDLVGRYGGEEFCVLLPRCADGEALRVAGRICAESARLPARLADGREVAYTVSIGVATASNLAPPAAKLDGVIAQADDALYQAKALGRNQVRVAWGSPAYSDPQLSQVGPMGKA